MLLPSNASRLVRLHRLAALGMALANDSASALSSSAVRALLKRDDIGGERITQNEDPYSEILVQSMSFFGGEYLVSPGSGDHTVSDVENLADAAFREDWMPSELRGPVRQLIQGLLIVSNLVLTRADLVRGTRPQRSPKTPVDVPSAARLEQLGRAAYLSHADLRAHGEWLHMVVDTFALDPGELTDPCNDDVFEDRLIVTPFLRLADGYQLAVPLDLLLTIRHHLLRFAYQAGELAQLGRRYRDAAMRRIERQLPRDAARQVLSEEDSMNRYLFSIDPTTDLHVLVATDPLTGWSPDEVWGAYDNHVALDAIGSLIHPRVRSTYSSAEAVLHLIVTDSPGRSTFWGVPNLDGLDPVLLTRADDAEVMLHRETDGVLGLLYFAEAIDRRPGESMTTNILDEYSAYEESEKSFYFSDQGTPNFVLFQACDGYFEREKYFEETDRHGVIAPVEGRPIVPVRRRYNRDAPEIFVTDPNSSLIGYVVELGSTAVFIGPNLEDEPAPDIAALLLETVAFWVRECGVRIGVTPSPHLHLVVSPGPATAWTGREDAATDDPPVLVTTNDTTIDIRVTGTFVQLLQEESNVAERHLVASLLEHLFRVDAMDVTGVLDTVAPLGRKRMLNAFNENDSPYMRGDRLPSPLTGHAQVTAQVLDELGGWLRDPSGAHLPVKPLVGGERSEVLNKAVGHLFSLVEDEIAQYDAGALLDYLISQNESLVHFATYNTTMLRSRLACFGADAETTRELIEHRKQSATAQRANRFLIEYVAARPPHGERQPTTRDYYRLLALAEEIIERGTASDFLHYELADFEVSILESGRLGISRDEPVTKAMASYADAAGARAVRTATEPLLSGSNATAGPDIIAESADAMRSEYGFTLSDLREVCGGLLDVASAEQITRMPRADVVNKLVATREVDRDVANAVLDAITLVPRDDFMAIGPDAVPWRFNRNMSYVRRPLILQDHQLVWGFRSVYNTGPYWYDSLTSGRLQASAKTQAMKAYISKARGRINDRYAEDVAARLSDLGLSVELAVTKIGGTRITDPGGLDLGDIDVLAWHSGTRTILAVEAKDFEVARTPAEMAHEITKLFRGRSGRKPERSTVDKHSRRIDWLRTHISTVLAHLGVDLEASTATVAGVIVTSEPLVTPLVESSAVPVVPFADLTLEVLHLSAPQRRTTRRRRSAR